MSNIHLSQPPTELLISRLKILLENVTLLYKANKSVVEEDIVSTYSASINLFLKSLDKSILSAVNKIFVGSPADPLYYNVITQAIGKDLEALFSEVGVLDKLLVSSFNSIIAEREQVIQVSKRISDKLGTYLLYADSYLGGGYFFGDSFNSAEHIDTGSSLVDGDECFLGFDEGVVLLPLDGKPIQPKVTSYTINASSNGTPGNNFEIGVVGKSDLEVIGDSEPNTWFEYEKVVSYESDRALILDLTITLEAISIINHIHINPINFGTPTPVLISTLETSRDGIEYTSIKDEIPLKDFISEEEDNVFSLSPATNKFVGQGFFSFLPRKAKYIHIVLRQDTPYSIKTLNGERLRYSIGIRDIEILGRKFKTKGSLVSTPFSSEEEIKKVAIWASENPVEQSNLADISHFISENDGATWRQIQPQRRSGYTVPEIIDFNTETDRSIKTDTAVGTLRHKIGMERFPKAFEGNVVLKEERISKVDILSIPTGGDFSFTTLQKPIKETIRVVLPFYGSYSCPTARYGASIVGKSAIMDLDFLEFTVDVPPIDSLRFMLPFTGFADLQEHIRVFVNGEQIEYCAKDATALGTNTYTSYNISGGVDENSKVYFLNRGGRELQFGYTPPSDTRKGFLPPTGAKIQICFDGDNPRLELTNAGYMLNLTSASDGFKGNVSIVTFNNLSNEEAADCIIELSPGRDKFEVKSIAGIQAVNTAKPIQAERASLAGNVSHSNKASAASTRRDRPTLAASKAPSTLSFSRSTELVSTADAITKAVNVVEKAIITEAEEGMLPPIFLDKNDDGERLWEIVEYDLTGASASSQFTNPVDFVDGRQELMLYDGSTNTWVIDSSAYTFDSYSGRIYLGSTPNPGRKTIFKCKKLEHTLVPEEGWEYYRTVVHGKVDTQKIILDPKYVMTHSRETSVDGTASPLTAVHLLADSDANLSRTHNWFKQRLVKGTIIINPTLFSTGIKPTEVVYINGSTELHNTVDLADELIVLQTDVPAAGYTTYTCQLAAINTDNTLVGLPGFAPVRSISDPNTPASLFKTYQGGGVLSGHGDWTFTIDGTTGVCTVSLLVEEATVIGDHTAKYKYQILDSGVDLKGLYSIDYETGTIHFAENITTTGTIRFEVSVYSAFYNIAEVVQDNDITSIDEDNSTITLSASLGMKFLKLSTALKARPGFAKIIYEYYKQTTESLKDLESYFSPICKDIAVKAITVSTFEEL